MLRPTSSALFRTFGVCIIVAIFVLSLMPSPPGVPGSDKLHHFLAYGGCMFAWAMALARPKSRFIALLLICAMGVLIEVLQGWTGWRTFDVADMVANTLGALSGWVAARIAAGLQRRFGFASA
ncbi:MAG: VanZ family protein [Betaproteobacteria bacterium]|nr:VanZ family protein [Betaproteobacteria bacterium]